MSCGFWLVCLDTASPKTSGCSDAVAVDGAGLEGLEENWMRRGSYARSWGVVFVLCPCSLKFELMKRYVGGLGASAFNCLHIGLVASAMI